MATNGLVDGESRRAERRPPQPRLNGADGHANGHAQPDGVPRPRRTSAAGDHVDERKLLEVLTSLRKGTFTPRLPSHWTGVAGQVADTVNSIMDSNLRMTRAVRRHTASPGPASPIDGTDRFPVAG